MTALRSNRLPLLAIGLILSMPQMSRAEDSPLARAVQALGGVERLRSFDEWNVQGEGRENLAAELQGREPETPTWRPHWERLAVDPRAGTVAWERRTPRNDESVRWRRFIYSPDSTGVVDWTAGWGRMRAAPATEATRAALLRRIPHLLLLDAATRGESIRTRDVGFSPEGLQQQTLEVRFPEEVRLALTFTGTPPVLSAVEYPVEMPGAGTLHVRWSWHDWHRDDTLVAVPGRHVVTVGGIVFQEVSYTRFEARPGVARDLLAIPAGLRAASPAIPPEAPPVPGGPATGEVAPGVHVVDVAGFLGMFVEGRDFVVVFDTPAAAPGLESIPARGGSSRAQAALQLREAISRTCPGKPIRAVVVSHHHSDHLGGVGAFAAPGVTFLASPSHVDAVRRALVRAADAGEMRDVKVEPVAERHVLDAGERRIEVIQVGDNPHTAESLFLWLPESRLVLQGDLFYYEEGESFPPSGRATMNRFFARWLDAHAFAPAAVYGLHGEGGAGPEALARALRPEPPSLERLRAP